MFFFKHNGAFPQKYTTPYKEPNKNYDLKVLFLRR